MIIKKRRHLFNHKHLKSPDIKLVVDVVHPPMDGYTQLKTIDLDGAGAPKLDWIFDEYWEEA
jgi:hypothetical protein